jgi:hypothetical protein
MVFDIINYYSIMNECSVSMTRPINPNSQAGDTLVKGSKTPSQCFPPRLKLIHPITSSSSPTNPPSNAVHSQKPSSSQVSSSDHSIAHKQS